MLFQVGSTHTRRTRHMVYKFLYTYNSCVLKDAKYKARNFKSTALLLLGYIDKFMHYKLR